MRGYQQVLLDPAECVLLVVDHQPQMYFGIEGKKRACVLNAVKGLTKTAAIFQVPVVMTTVTAVDFGGPMVKGVLDVFAGHHPIDRTTLNAWEDTRVKKAVNDTKRKKLLIAGLWTEVCATLPALSAMQDGFEVYVVVDACGGSSYEAHDAAVLRMTQNGVTPVTWQSVLLEFQRDWADKATYAAVNALITECGGAYGLGLEYAKVMKKS
ncbi:MAG: hydrolase [Clostridiales bacterium]|jgi:nicotinamidase-related amidase|nr:hydrolase [Clostridiales bacterium]